MSFAKSADNDQIKSSNPSMSSCLGRLDKASISKVQVTPQLNSELAVNTAYFVFTAWGSADIISFSYLL